MIPNSRKVINVAIDALLTIAFLLIILSVLFVYWINQGRFISASNGLSRGSSIISEYISKGQRDKYTCELHLEEGYPKSTLNGIQKLWANKDIVLEYSWVCNSTDDSAEGFFSIFADGGAVWAGTSKKRGDLTTEEY